MPPANPHRGEVAVILDGREFTLRPTWQAIVEIETATGQGIVEIARIVAAGRYGLTIAAHIITAGLKAADEPATMDKVCGLIFKTGIANIAPSLDEFLSNCLTGGMEPGEAKAVDQT